MLTQWTLFFIGILVAAVPFLGLPPSFDNFILVLAGLSVSFIAGRAVREWSQTAHRQPATAAAETENLKEKES